MSDTMNEKWEKFRDSVYDGALLVVAPDAEAMARSLFPLREIKVSEWAAPGTMYALNQTAEMEWKPRLFNYDLMADEYMPRNEVRLMQHGVIAGRITNLALDEPAPRPARRSWWSRLKSWPSRISPTAEDTQ